MSRTFTWRVAASDGVDLTLTATADGLVALAAEPAGPARLDSYQREALAVALEAADRTATGLLTRRERGISE